MTSFNQRHTHWTETHRVIRGRVKVVTCCCTRPAAKARECADSRGLKSRCACFCHSDRVTCEDCEGRGWNSYIMQVSGDSVRVTCLACNGKRYV